MKNHQKRNDAAAGMVWALVNPMVVILGGMFMLVMLALLGMEAGMLKAYWQSERVYAAGTGEIDPAHENHLVRVTGPLCTDETLSAGNLGTYSGVIEIQDFSTIAHADELRLGAWQVEGLYGVRSNPFTYFAINTPGVNWVEVGDEKLALLPSGVEVTLVGRQRGNTLDMADPVCTARLGKPAAGFLDHVNDSPNADFSLRSFQSIAIFALLAYFGTWLLLGLAIRQSMRWGVATGAVVLLVVAIIAAVL